MDLLGSPPRITTTTTVILAKAKIQNRHEPWCGPDWIG
jgi:hypothetical protein